MYDDYMYYNISDESNLNIHQELTPSHIIFTKDLSYSAMEEISQTPQRVYGSIHMLQIYHNGIQNAQSILRQRRNNTEHSNAMA